MERIPPENPLAGQEARENKPERRGFFLTKTAELLARLFTKEFRVEGKEHIPAGECLVIAHHDSHFDGHAMLGALTGNDAGIVGHETAASLKKIFNWMGTPGVRQVGSQLNPEDRKVFRDSATGMAEIIKRQEDPKTKWEDKRTNLEAIREVVEDLVKGKKMVYFPEGGWYKKGDTALRNPTDGVKIIARMYKKRTGKDLLILPAGIEGAASVFGADPEKPEMGAGLLSALRKKINVVTVRFGPAFTVSRQDDFGAIFKDKVGSLQKPTSQS